jgi:mannose-6-phosphate isomerase-like protein (cupin superfamily)
MKFILNPIKVLFAFILVTNSGFAQEKPIIVEELYSDTNSSTFHITIKDSVSLHYHAAHTENIFVLEGTATMRLGNETMEIQKGDYLIIPPETAHAVWVTSKIPLKVISIQSPMFLGEDRHYLSNE